MNQETKNLAIKTVSIINELDEKLSADLPTTDQTRTELMRILRSLEALIDSNGAHPRELDILEEALNITNGDRQADYGSAAQSFGRIADLWTIYLGPRLNRHLTPIDVAQMMVLLKVSRSVTTPKRDTFVDQAGYSRLAHVLATNNHPF